MFTAVAMIVWFCFLTSSSCLQWLSATLLACLATTHKTELRIHKHSAVDRRSE